METAMKFVKVVKYWTHKALGKIWHALGRLLVKTKHWDENN